MRLVDRWALFCCLARLKGGETLWHKATFARSVHTITKYSQRFRHLVSLGAAITVLALAFEPFFQQSVSFSNRIVVTGNSTLAVASSYRPLQGPRYTAWTRNFGAVRDDSALALQIANTITSEVPSDQSIPSVCPTGRCSWAPFSSLGVCQQCKIVSDALMPVCQRKVIAKVNNVSGALNPCGYRLNATFVTGLHGLNGGFETSVVGLTTIMVGSKEESLGRRDYWNSTHFRNSPYAISNFYVAYVPGGYPQVLRNATPVLLECLFQWCVKTMEASHVGGRLQESVLSIYRPPDAGSKYSAPGTAPHAPFSLMAGDKSFTVAANATLRINHALLANLPWELSNITSGPSKEDLGNWNFIHTAPYNINTLLDPIADTMSDYLRSQANTGVEQVSGSAWGPEPFVKTQWLWLLLPCSLLLGTLLLICGTIAKSRKQKVPSWKSSALATLLHGLSQETRAQFAVDAQQSEIEAVSQKLHVKMQSYHSAGKLEAVEQVSKI